LFLLFTLRYNKRNALSADGRNKINVKNRAHLMAIARLSIKVGKAGKAGPHSSYIAREGQYAKYLERGEKLEATEAGNMPAWAQVSAQAFWNAADAHERVNGTTYREMEIALPRELSAEQRLALVRDFVQQELGERHAYQWAIHSPTAADGGEQPHVHLMFSERQCDGIERDPEQYFKRYNAKVPENGGARKGYGPHAGQTLTAVERRADLVALRGRWEVMANQHLEQGGFAERIDMRSHAERGTDLVPEAKQLPSQWRAEGRSNVLEWRAARVEQREAADAVRQVLPNVSAEIISIEDARQRRAQVNAQVVEGVVAFRQGYQAYKEQQAATEAARLRVQIEQEQQREQARQAAAVERAAAEKIRQEQVVRTLPPKSKDYDGPGFG
jgi:hypothetical protein